MVVESVSGAEVGEQLPSRNILEQHVEKAIIVMSPDPVSAWVEWGGGMLNMCVCMGGGGG